MLRRLVVTNKACPPTDFTLEPWCNSFRVIPRHGVRRLWNNVAVRKHCLETGAGLFVCDAEDSIQGKPLDLRQRYAVVSRNATKGPKYRNNDLPSTVELTLGMKVIMTRNVEIDLDITNGARGVIVDIILDPEEPLLSEGPIAKLKHLPAYLLSSSTGLGLRS